MTACTQHAIQPKLREARPSQRTLPTPRAPRIIAMTPTLYVDLVSQPSRACAIFCKYVSQAPAPSVTSLVPPGWPRSAGIPAPC